MKIGDKQYEKFLRPSVYFITIVSVIVAIPLVILFHGSYGGLVDTIASLIVAAFIALFTYHYQSQDELRITEILGRINKISEQQKRVHIFPIQQPLTQILQKITELRDILRCYELKLKEIETNEPGSIDESFTILSELKKNMTQTFEQRLMEIEDSSKNIEKFIGQIHQEILAARSYLYPAVSMELNPSDPPNRKKEIINYWKENLCRNAKLRADIIRDQIDYFLFDMLDSESLETVKLRDILFSDCPIVIGSIRNQDKITKESPWEDSPYDRVYAERLFEQISKKCNNKKKQIKLDKNIQEGDKRNNLILLGGMSINDVTREISSYLPLQLMLFGSTIYSRISTKFYCSSNNALIQAIRNPFAKDKIILIVFGFGNKETETGIQVLADLINNKVREEDFNNSYVKSFKARIISRTFKGNKYSYEWLE